MRGRFNFPLMILAALITVAPFAAAADDRNAAPFGLEWGMSSAEVRELGLELKDAQVRDYGTSFTATKLPKIISDVETVLLSFGYNDKLWRVAALSRTFANDPHGSAVISRFDELAAVLVEKYGRGTPHYQYDPNPLMKGEDFLYQVEAGKAWHYTDFATPTIHVQLIIGASSTSDGSYRIIFEHKPLRADFEKGKKFHEKDAL